MSPHCKVCYVALRICSACVGLVNVLHQKKEQHVFSILEARQSMMIRSIDGMSGIRVAYLKGMPIINHHALMLENFADQHEWRG